MALAKRHFDPARASFEAAPHRRGIAHSGEISVTEDRLVATYWTVAGAIDPGFQHVSPFGLDRRAEAAAAAGYWGMGLSHEDLKANVEKHGLRNIRKVFDNAGLPFLEVECLLNWFGDGPDRAASNGQRAFLLETAAELRTNHIKIMGDVTGSGVSIEKMAEEFHDLCEEAAQVGAFVSLEVFPGSNINNLATATRFMELAQTTKGGLLIDIWHMTRGGVSTDEIARLPLSYLRHVELNDAAAEQMGSIFEDTMNNRMLPGEGSFDFPAFLGAIRSTGYTGPYGVEIFSRAFRLMEPEAAAQRSFDATKSQIDRSRRLADEVA